MVISTGVNLGHRPTDTSPLSNLTSLTSLNLFGACTRSTQFGFLSQMKRMKALELSHNFLNDIAAPHVSAVTPFRTTPFTLHLLRCTEPTQLIAGFGSALCMSQTPADVELHHEGRNLHLGSFWSWPVKLPDQPVQR